MTACCAVILDAHWNHAPMSLIKRPRCVYSLSGG